MKQYMLSVHGTGENPYATEADMYAAFERVGRFNDDLQASGQYVFACGLMPADTASVVRTEGGRRAVTDGPFSESKEQLGGFWIVKAPDLDAALEIAERGSIACAGPVEVRPLQDEPEDED